jgi:hypothetical protein
MRHDQTAVPATIRSVASHRGASAYKTLVKNMKFLQFFMMGCCISVAVGKGNPSAPLVSYVKIYDEKKKLSQDDILVIIGLANTALNDFERVISIHSDEYPIVLVWVGISNSGNGGGLLLSFKKTGKGWEEIANSRKPWVH